MYVQGYTPALAIVMVLQWIMLQFLA